MEGDQEEEKVVVLCIVATKIKTKEVQETLRLLQNLIGKQ
jgi:hypothetical protein